MDAARLRRALTIVGEVIDSPPGERAALLAAACGDDTMLLDEVCALLGAHDASTRFLEPPASDGAPVGDDVCEVIANYRILGTLGTGGMGRVYLAEQASPRRRVALKVLAGPWTPEALARFALEAEVLGRLRHPGIAAVYESGIDGDGARRLPYLAIELVEGALPINEFADAHRLDRLHRLQLFQRVCDAVHHGHMKGVVHRDLKPSNILVDQHGRAKVIDFGIARLADDEAHRTRLTHTGFLLGTPAFMAPEQCSGDVGAIDLRSDVYALGVVLYETLCGAPPIDVDRLPLPQAIEAVRTRPPRRPRSIVADLPRDIETILLTALDKDPAKRYRSVEAMSADIGRYIQNRPIEARPTTAVHQLRLFAKRHRTMVAASVVMIAALLIATAVSTWFVFALKREAGQREKAEAAALTQRDEARRKEYVATLAAAAAALEAGEYPRLRDRLAAAPAMHRGWEWEYLQRRAEVASLIIHADRLRTFAIVPTADGSGIWSAGTDGSARRWNTTSRELERSTAPMSGGVQAMTVSADGRRVIVGGESGLLEIRDADTDRVIASCRGHSDRVMGVALSPDGERIASVARDGTVRVWRSRDGSELRTVAMPGAVRGVAWCDDESVAVIGEGLGLRIVDASTGDVRIRAELPGIQNSVLVSPALRRIFVADNDPRLLVYDMDDRDGAPPTMVLAHPRAVWTAAVSPDGERLVTGGSDAKVRIWRVADGTLLRTLGGHAEVVYASAFSADGTLWTSGWDGMVRRWDVGPDERHDDDATRITMSDDVIYSLNYSCDGAIAAIGGRNGRVRLVDADDRATIREWTTGHGACWCVAFNAAGSMLATGDGNGGVTLSDTDDGRAIARLVGHTERVFSVAFAPDGNIIATGSADGTLRLWERARSGDDSEWATVWTSPSCGKSVWIVAFSPDGTMLASGSWDHKVRVFHVESRAMSAELEGHLDTIYALAWSPDGATLASGGRDRRVILWDPVSRMERRRFAQPGQFIGGLAWIPDCSRLVGASWFGRVLVWEPASGELLLSLRVNDTAVRCLAIRPDGKDIMGGCSDGGAWVWSTR